MNSEYKVQKKDTVIDASRQIPFVFKDVDFDGEKEILFRCTGYNNYSWAPFKIMAPGRAEYMYGMPSMVIEDNDMDGRSYASFHYDTKTICTETTSGCCDWYYCTYRRKTNVTNPLVPMERIREIHISGSSSQTRCEYEGRMEKRHILRYCMDYDVTAYYNRHKRKMLLDSITAADIKTGKVIKRLDQSRIRSQSHRHS